MVKVHIIARGWAIRIRGFRMGFEFDRLPWHDAELLSVNVDRSDAGNSDTVSLSVKWPDGKKETIIFEDCYLFDARMNFGVISEEAILEGVCLNDTEKILEIKEKWHRIGVDLNGIHCYRIITNSTNSQIEVYALSYTLF